ncbi:hypothetical protein AMTR_s00077p00174920 [Amborella trichopoda]|uniref:Uncharacterized protein n=1 Tax=Amborella trichopoda TaxID=13333 RepID=W1P364_AMBTC|nr:hypothetical protein AMTR_s00077p00174920 [Amborella trichopoda]
MSSDSEYSPSSRGKDMDECSLDSLARNHESVPKGNVERSSFELDEPSTNIWFEVENNTQWFDQHHHIRQRFLDGQVQESKFKIDRAYLHEMETRNPNLPIFYWGGYPNFERRSEDIEYEDHSYGALNTQPHVAKTREPRIVNLDLGMLCGTVVKRETCPGILPGCIRINTVN